MIDATGIWWAHQRRMDQMIDRQYSEPVEFYPWDGGQHVADIGQADPTRAVLKTEAIYNTPGAHAMGEAGTLASGMATNIQTSREWLSIMSDKLGDPITWRAYDRVYLPRQNPSQQWHSIEKIEPAATKRHNVYLIRLQQGTP
jgi:hypothetical protein